MSKKKTRPIFSKDPITSSNWQELEHLTTDGRLPKSGEVARPLVDNSGNLEYDQVGRTWYTRPGAR